MQSCHTEIDICVDRYIRYICTYTRGTLIGRAV